ncbi:hypothetical protein Leryth_007115, partial [Lithospermum erythrorhizon]
CLRTHASLNCFSTLLFFVNTHFFDQVQCLSDVIIGLCSAVLLELRAAAIPRAKGGARLQMNLVYNQFAPVFLFLLQWMDCSFSYLLPRYLNLFHVVIYKVYKNGRPEISRHGRKASVSDFYGLFTI